MIIRLINKRRTINLNIKNRRQRIKKLLINNDPKPEKPIATIGATIYFFKNYGDVIISNERDAWIQENIIGYGKSGATATVLDYYEEKLPGSNRLFTRYKIKTNYNNKMISGWVHGHEISN